MTMGGYEVLKGETTIGYIGSGRQGFFTSPSTIKAFVDLSPDDLRQIAEGIEKCQKHKYI
jgi:hypothetical protein